jgi:hypothetical protein
MYVVGSIIFVVSMCQEVRTKGSGLGTRLSMHVGR